MQQHWATLPGFWAIHCARPETGPIHPAHPCCHQYQVMGPKEERMSYKERAEVIEELTAIAKKYDIPIMLPGKPHYPDGPYSGYNPASWDQPADLATVVKRILEPLKRAGIMRQGFKKVFGVEPPSLVIEAYPDPEEWLKTTGAGYAEAMEDLPGGECAPISLVDSRTRLKVRKSDYTGKSLDKVLGYEPKPADYPTTIITALGKNSDRWSWKYRPQSITVQKPADYVKMPDEFVGWPEICPVCGEPGNGCTTCRDKYPEEFTPKPLKSLFLDSMNSNYTFPLPEPGDVCRRKGHLYVEGKCVRCGKMA